MSKDRHISKIGVFAFLAIFLFATNQVSALSLKKSFLNIFNLGTRTESVQNDYERKETVQNLKFLEPNKVLAESLQNTGPRDISPNDSNSLLAGKSLATGEDIVEASKNPSDNTFYTVQSGDTIGSIANYFNISSETILEANKDKKIKEGVVLEIPPISGTVYVVKKGDTLEKIASAYKIDSDDISLYNGFIRSEDLVTGDAIFLPGVRIGQDKNDKKDTKKNKNSKNSVTIVSKYIPKNFVYGDTSHLNKPANVIKYANYPKYEGFYLFPAPGANRTQKLHGNNGCDLASYNGAPVVAAAAGVVRVAKNGGYNFGFGNYIVITHSNGTETVYGHLSEADVNVGQAVSRGQSIGKVGSSGNSTGPHLHFEIHGAYNPWAW